MTDQDFINIGKRKMLWQEIKHLGYEYNRNAAQIMSVQKEQIAIEVLLDEKLKEIQALAEAYDYKFMLAEIENDK